MLAKEEEQFTLSDTLDCYWLCFSVLSTTQGDLNAAVFRLLQQR